MGNPALIYDHSPRTLTLCLLYTTIQCAHSLPALNTCLQHVGSVPPQVLNPPFVHALAVPQVASSCRPWSQLAAVALGDGSVHVLDADMKPDECAVGASSSGKTARPSSKVRKHQQRPKGQAFAGAAFGSVEAVGAAVGAVWAVRTPGAWVGPRRWGREEGGHSRPAAAVAFVWEPPGGLHGGGQERLSPLESDGGPAYVVSGSQDKRLLLWGLRMGRMGEAGGCGAGQGQQGESGMAELEHSETATAHGEEPHGPQSRAPLVEVQHGRKVNCLHSWSQLIAVADTSRQLTLYRFI